MPYDDYYKDLDPLQQKINEAANQYGAYNALNPTIGQQILDAIKGSGNFVTSAEIRNEYGDTSLPPAAREALIAQRTASERGSTGDIINRAVGGYQSETARMKGELEASQLAYENAKAEADARMAYDQWEQQMELNRRNAPNPEDDYEAKLEKAKKDAWALKLEYASPIMMEVNGTNSATGQYKWDDFGRYGDAYKTLVTAHPWLQNEPEIADNLLGNSGGFAAMLPKPGSSTGSTSGGSMNTGPGWNRAQPYGDVSGWLNPKEGIPG